MIDVTELIDPEQIPLCPLCDQPIEYGATPATAHGLVFMVCMHCAAEVGEQGAG